MLPAVAQGVIALEVRRDDLPLLELCKTINHKFTWDLIKAERGFLETMNADCDTPLAAFARKVSSSTELADKIHCEFLLASLDGSNMYTYSEIFDLENGYDIGVKAAKIILNQAHLS